MLFNSAPFLLLFLPAARGAVALASRVGGTTVAGWTLVAASLLFYGAWNPAFLPLLGGSIGFNYAASRVILARPGKAGGIALGIALATDLGALVHYKYLADLLDFLHQNGLAPFTMASPALPLGISFFTFTQIGYLIDCRSQISRGHGLRDYLLFVTFFPHLIAGPILHHREIVPQFSGDRIGRISGRNISVGTSIFVIGLAKKTLLADPLGPMVAYGFDHAGTLGALSAWHAACGYSLQLYFDFSGYSDMAIGLARMFNIRFPANFDSPYKASSIIEYWQRWHMTLTRYLTLYLFNPLALRAARARAAQRLPVGRAAQASAGGFARLVGLPIAITMTLAGIWHGSGLTFLTFGLLHAVYLIVNHAWRVFGPRRGQPSRMHHASAVGLTYLAVLAGAVIFRAPSLNIAGQMLANMVGRNGAGLPDPVNAHATLNAVRSAGWLATLYVVVWAAPNTQQIMRRAWPVLESARRGPSALVWRPSVAWAAAIGIAAALGLLSLGGTSEFLYFRF